MQALISRVLSRRAGFEDVKKDFPGAEVVCGDVTDMSSLRTNGFAKPVDVVVSCLASRTGGLQVPKVSEARELSELAAGHRAAHGSSARAS